MSIAVSLGSWADPQYVGLIYPKGVPAGQRLHAYARVFDRVEVNASYYTTPRANVVSGWAKQTPAGFIFDIKLHRAFSQSPEKTARDGRLLTYLFNGVKPLMRAGKLGAFLLVAAPSFRPERNRLEELDTLAEKLRPHLLAVELRHRDWVTGKNRARTLAYFRERGLVWVSVDMPRIPGADLMPPIDEVTHPDLAYLRLHGRNRNWAKAESAAERHAYEYPARAVREVAARVHHLAAEAKHVQVVANNHAHDYAPKLALALRELLEPRDGRGLAGKVRP
jgi:uncharacterized protein YecE (DUF72 family)